MADNLHDLLSALHRRLSETGELVSISENFAALSTDLQRVKFAAALLEKFQLLPRTDAGNSKSDRLSQEFRESGNRLFKAKKDGEALEMYTKGAAYAEKGSESLGLAFANRSAVLFEFGLYRECLEDIDNALANNYPTRLLDKLQTRRSKARSLLSNQPPSKPFSDLPPLSSALNPLIQCASDAVAVTSSETMGRYVVAAKDIAAGDVIALEKPFAKMALKDKILDHCHNCLGLCHNLLPCEGCTGALFCSKGCMQEAMEGYHGFECPVLGFLHRFEFSKLELMALRVVIQARDYYEKEPSFKGSDVYASGRYEEIHQLVTNSEKRPVADLFKKATVAAVLSHVFKNSSSLLPDEQLKDGFSRLLMRHLQTAPSNFHEISECVGSKGGCYATEDVGSGAFSFLSLFNHSCSPNIVRHCHGFTVVLRVLRPVRKGEQLFDNYGYHHAVMCKEERQDHLKSQYLFQCACKACEEDWPLYHHLKSLDYDLELDEDDLMALREGSVETARKIVHSLIKKLEELDHTIPSRNLADAQEVVKQCFALFGNKRTMF